METTHEHVLTSAVAGVYTEHVRVSYILICSNTLIFCTCASKYIIVLIMIIRAIIIAGEVIL